MDGSTFNFVTSAFSPTIPLSPSMFAKCTPDISTQDTVPSTPGDIEMTSYDRISNTIDSPISLYPHPSAPNPPNTLSHTDIPMYSILGDHIYPPLGEIIVNIDQDILDDIDNDIHCHSARYATVYLPYPLNSPPQPPESASKPIFTPELLSQPAVTPHIAVIPLVVGSHTI